jgi:hypothetical protein
MRDAGGRKAIIVVSSGLDTFSRATFQQVLEAARAQCSRRIPVPRRSRLYEVLAWLVRNVDPEVNP